MNKNDEKLENNENAFAKQVEPKIGMGVQKHIEAKSEMFNKEQELFYRATSYRGS